MQAKVLAVNESNDKHDCFARISESKCNALQKKECKNCSFYKPKSEVPNYKSLLDKDLIYKKGKN